MTAPSTRRAALGAILAAPLASVPALAAEPHPDAELLTLGLKLDEAWAAERAVDDAPEPVWLTACRRTRAVVEEIEKIAATTLDGLKVKARACSWCHCGEPFDEHSFSDHGATDTSLAAGILRDILALGA